MDKSAKRSKKWQKRFNVCEENQREDFKQASKYYDVMYAVMNTSKMAPWRSKVYVPILASKAWDLISRFADITPLYNVSVKNEFEINEETGDFGYTKDANQVIEKLEHLMQDEYHNAPGEPMELRAFDSILDAVVAGTGFAKTPWVYDEEKQYARKTNEDGEIIDNTEQIEKTIRHGHNDFQPITYFNMFYPEAPSFFKAPYHIVREYTTIQDAEDSGLYDKEALNKLRKNVEQDESFVTYNRTRNRLAKGSDKKDDTVKQIVIYECYENGSIYTYGEGKSAEGWVELHKPKKKAYWHGRPCLVPFMIRKKPFSGRGESLFENNARLQSAVNDLFNHYLDNWNLSIDQMIMYEDNTLTSDFVVQPGGEITYTGAKPEQFSFSDPNPNQLTSVLEVINQAIEAATVPQYLSGVPNSDLDKTGGTATGINLITEAATEKVGFMRKNIKQSMRIVGQNWVSNLQQFQDRPRELQVVQNGVRKPMIVMPGELQREIEVDIDDDSMIPISKEQKRQTIEAFQANAMGMQKASIQQAQIFGTPEDMIRLNFNEMLEDAADIYSVKNFTKYLKATPKAPVAGDDGGATEDQDGVEQEEVEAQGAI